MTFGLSRAVQHQQSEQLATRRQGFPQGLGSLIPCDSRRPYGKKAVRDGKKVYLHKLKISIAAAPGRVLRGKR